MKTHLLLTTLLAACTFLPAQINSIPAGSHVPGVITGYFTFADTACGGISYKDLDQDGVDDLRFSYSFVHTQTWGRAAITVEGLSGTLVLAEPNPPQLTPGTYAVAFPGQSPVPGLEQGYLNADVQLSESSLGGPHISGPFAVNMLVDNYMGLLLSRQGVLYPAWIQILPTEDNACAWTPCPCLQLTGYGYSTTPLVSRPNPIPGAGLSVYPNPAQTQVRIESTAPVKAFEIRDVQGRVLLRGAGGYAWDADVSALPAGLCLCTVHTDAGTLTQRLRVDAAP